MATRQNLLFSWDDVDQLPDLERLERVLEALPDEALIAALEARRGRGRNDYPVRALWRAVVAMVVLQHPSIAALVRELRRNRRSCSGAGSTRWAGGRRVQADGQTW